MFGRRAYEHSKYIARGNSTPNRRNLVRRYRRVLYAQSAKSIGEKKPILGMHIAFRAFTKYVELNGAEPHVRDSQLRALTDEQLFFISGARMSCDDLAGDWPGGTHPGWSTRFVSMLRNMGAFRDAFNCPIGSFYAPKATMCATIISNPRPVEISK